MAGLLRIDGFEPDKYGTNWLKLYRGPVANLDGTEEIEWPQANDIDMTQVGWNGRDHAGPIVEGAFYAPYLIKNTVTGELGAVLSRSRFYVDNVIPESVILPPNCVNFRKKRFGFVYKAAWGGIPDFHECSGHVNLTWEESPSWQVRNAAHPQGRWNTGGAWQAYRLPVSF